MVFRAAVFKSLTRLTAGRAQAARGRRAAPPEVLGCSHSHSFASSPGAGQVTGTKMTSQRLEPARDAHPVPVAHPYVDPGVQLRGSHSQGGSVSPGGQEHGGGGDTTPAPLPTPPWSRTPPNPVNPWPSGPAPLTSPPPSRRGMSWKGETYRPAASSARQAERLSTRPQALGGPQGGLGGSPGSTPPARGGPGGDGGMRGGRAGCRGHSLRKRRYPALCGAPRSSALYPAMAPLTRRPAPPLCACAARLSAVPPAAHARPA